MTEDWQAPITLFLQGYYHPTDVSEAKRLRHRSRDFALIEGQLYMKRATLCRPVPQAAVAVSRQQQPQA